MARVGIVGLGFVGRAYARLMERKHEVVMYDPHYEGVDPYPNSKELVQSSDLAIVCVPTPARPSGHADLSVLLEVFEWLRHPKAILIKSTVPPGTTRHINRMFFPAHDMKVCFSPEYVGSEPTWPSRVDPSDPLTHGFMTVGGFSPATEKVLGYFKPVLGAETRYMVASPEAAELAKYMENTFLALKVTFCNEWADIAALWDVPYSIVRELWLADPRIGSSHTLVFDEDRGFGGRCLPKDLSAIIESSEVRGYLPELLQAVKNVNKKWRPKGDLE